MISPGSVSIKIEGFNRARLLSELRKEEIKVSRVRDISRREFALSVRKKDLQKTFAILDRMCYNYSTTGISESEKTLFGFLKRAGLFAGVLIFGIMLSFSRGYVWRIEISGNDNVPDKLIENALAANRIAVGKKLSLFDKDSVEASVRAIDGINLVSCYLRGTTVVVEVFESAAVSPPLSFSDTDILSGFDATVTRVITREGTALVKPGQNVFAGTPLIGAYRLGEEGADPIPSRASGIVYGKVAYTFSVTVAEEWYEYVPEKVSVRTRVKLFGLTLGKKLPKGENYEITETTRKLNVFLPVSVKTARIVKMKKQKMTAPVEELAQKAEDEIVLSFINEHAPTGFKSSRTVRALGGGLHAVNVFIEAETVIGGA